MSKTKTQEVIDSEEFGWACPSDNDDGIVKKSIDSFQKVEIDKLTENQLKLDLNLIDLARQILAIAHNADLSEAAKIDRIVKVMTKSGLSEKFDNAVSDDKPDLPPFPTNAPELWVERTTGREVTPVDFIKKHYGVWVHKDVPPEYRLPRNSLGKLDPKLYSAYASWIGRHPEDDFGLPKDASDVLAELDELNIENYTDLRIHADENQMPVKEFNRLKSGLQRKLQK